MIIFQLRNKTPEAAAAYEEVVQKRAEATKVVFTMPQTVFQYKEPLLPPPGKGFEGYTPYFFRNDFEIRHYRPGSAKTFDMSPKTFDDLPKRKFFGKKEPYEGVLMWVAHGKQLEIDLGKQMYIEPYYKNLHVPFTSEYFLAVFIRDWNMAKLRDYIENTLKRPFAPGKTLLTMADIRDALNKLVYQYFCDEKNLYKIQRCATFSHINKTFIFPSNEHLKQANPEERQVLLSIKEDITQMLERKLKEMGAINNGGPLVAIGH